MKKIPTLFLRDEQDRRYVTREPHPDCLWVLGGEGVATRKYDGTCVRLTANGLWWARREVKPGRQTPDGFILEQRDDVTGKLVGWEPIERSAFRRYHAEALQRFAHRRRDTATDWPTGTYELVGPKINGNPEQVNRHYLWAHATADVLDAPRDFDALAKWLSDFTGEGIVWHHPDGRMAKIKRKDFPPVGLTRTPQR